MEQQNIYSEDVACNSTQRSRKKCQRDEIDCDRKYKKLKTAYLFDETEISIIMDVSNNPWFKGVDIARVLDMDYVNINIYKTIDKKYCKYYEELSKNLSQNNNVPFIHPQTTFVNKNGIILFIEKSGKPKSEKLAKWIKEVVLPSIWRNNGYEINSYDNAYKNFNEIKDLEGEKLRLENINAILEEENEKIKEEKLSLENYNVILKEENEKIKEKNLRLENNDMILKEENEKIKEEKLRFENNNGILKEENEKIKEEKLRLENINGILKEENEKIKEEKLRLEYNNAILDERTKNLELQELELKEKVKSLKEKKKKINDEKINLVEEKTRLEERNINLNEKLPSLERQITGLEQKNKSLEQKCYTYEESTKYYVNMVMQTRASAVPTLKNNLKTEYFVLYRKYKLDDEITESTDEMRTENESDKERYQNWPYYACRVQKESIDIRKHELLTLYPNLQELLNIKLPNSVNFFNFLFQELPNVLERGKGGNVQSFRISLDSITEVEMLAMIDNLYQTLGYKFIDK